MRRGALALSLLIPACRAAPAVPAEPPSHSARGLHPVPKPETEDDVPEPTPVPDPPSLAMVTEGPYKDLGFMRGEPSPDAPLLRATVLEPFGEGGDALAQRVIDQLDPVFDCFEATPPVDRAWISLRIGLDGNENGLTAQVGPDDAVEPGLESCVATAVEPLRPVGPGAQGAFSFDYFPRAADAPRLPEPGPSQRAAIRFGGACFVWIEEPPCPPRKRCFPDRWEPSMCPHRADQQGVYLRHHLADEPVRGNWSESEGLELTDPHGQPIWLAPWVDGENKQIQRFDAANDPFPPYRPYLLEMEDETIRVADDLGVRTHVRQTGERSRTWAAPPSGGGLFVDSATFRVQGKATCSGKTEHGRFAAVCGPWLLYFDNYTFAILDNQTLVPKAVTNLDAKTSSSHADGADVVYKLRAGGLKLTVRGIVYMD